MPNIWTHILFCDEIVEHVNIPKPMTERSALLRLGSQGPDPFFYYNFWPWMKDTPVNNIGSLLHTSNCGDFLMELILEAEDNNWDVKSYVFGFITHHILDRRTHPYIHYRAGYKKNKHQQLEVIIDTLMMENYRDIQTWRNPVYKQIDVGPQLNPTLLRVLNQMITNYYPEAVWKLPSDYIQKSYQDMKRALFILYDPHGWKNKVLGSMVSSFSHRPVKSAVDYLNKENNTWYHPATNEPFNESFIQLYTHARREGISILSVVINYWNNPNPKDYQQLKDLIGNISYDTGLPLTENYSNRYCDPIV